VRVQLVPREAQQQIGLASAQTPPEPRRDLHQRNP
jgi:hypothetical protein